MLKKIKSFSVPTLRRLPLYLKIARREQSAGKLIISCSDIARECRLDPILVRKDIASTGVVGQARCGFPIDKLIEAVEIFLGWRGGKDAFLVGVGHLGAALLKYEKFQEHGLMIIAAFDIDKQKTKQKIGNIPVFLISKLPDLAKRMRVPIGIITVNADTAQDIADIMVDAGIKAIWNFAPIVLKVPESILVENVSLSASLGVLTSQLNRQKDSDE
ncbi:MAG: redox-sensing transcriptional repressor Rex [Candidatus Omnitrophica bacterium]|nr:redox-sensing transcriptional repressor Rex [Candidatus Omnitrophota bacterium]